MENKKKEGYLLVLLKDKAKNILKKNLLIFEDFIEI